MDKSKCIRWAILVLMVIKSLSVYANEEQDGWGSYIKRSISSKISDVYRYFFTSRVAGIKPNPRLLSSNNFVLEVKPYSSGKGYTTYNGFVFEYDVSHDSNTLKALRKRLHISGLYLQDSWKMDDYEQHWRPMFKTETNRKILDRAGITVSQVYKERGFDENIDNSIVGCLERLFDEIIKTFNAIGGARWELKLLSKPSVGKKSFFSLEFLTDSHRKRQKQLAETKRKLSEALKKQSDNENDWKQLLSELENAIVQQGIHDFSITSWKGSGFVLDGLNENRFDNPIPAIWKKYTYYFYNDKFFNKDSLLYSEMALERISGLRE